MIQVVADITNVELEIVLSTEEKSKSLNGRFPHMETSNGTIISTPEAICKHIARMNTGSGLLGKTKFGQAKIDEWITWS
jgi:glutathione S-transferase